MSAPASIAAADAAKIFLDGSGWSDLLAEEALAAPTAHVDPVLVILAPWSDLGRHARALSIIDTELRRAASAWRSGPLGTVNEGLLRGLASTSDARSVVESFVVSLRRHERPAPESGRLHIEASRAHPPAVTCTPTGALADLLRHAPAAALTYALSAFNQGMLLSRAAHRTPSFGLGHDPMAWAAELAKAPTGSVGPVRHVPGRPATYRAIGGEHDGDAPSDLTALLLVEHTAERLVDVTAVTLTPDRTEIVAYGDAWRTLACGPALQQPMLGEGVTT